MSSTHFVTPSIASILSGARKYGLGLVLAHQETRQLRSRSEDVASAVLANAATRVVFRVGEGDAKALAEGFSFFESKDLQSLDVGCAIARVERADFDFNLRTQRLEPIDPRIASERRVVVAASRNRYATPREDVDATLNDAREALEANAAATEAEVPAKRSRRRSSHEVEESAPLPGRGGVQHKHLQNLIRKLGEDRGFTVSLETIVLDGHGYVDVLLERDGTRIGCEISVSTRAEHEIGNLTKCLAAGLDFAVLIAVQERTLVEARRLVETSDQRLRFLTPDAFISFLDSVVASPNTPDGRIVEKQSGRRLKPLADELPRGTDLLITEQAATRLGLAVGTLAKMRVSGEGPPFHKVGRRVMYSESDLIAWINARRRRSTSDPGARSEDA